MDDKTYYQKLLSNKQGTSREQRLLKEQDPGFAPVEGRNTADYLMYFKKYASLLKYYNQNNVHDGNWQPFFEDNPAMVIATMAKTDTEAIYGEFIGFVKQFANNGLNDAGALKDVFDHIIDTALLIESWNLKLDKGFKSKKDIVQAIQIKLAPAISGLQNYDLGYEDVSTEGNPLGMDYSGFGADWNLPGPTKDNSIYSSTNTAEDALTGIFLTIYNVLKKLVSSSPAYLNETLENYAAHQPHVGLLLAFIKLLEEANGELNDITGRHLDFYYRKVLNMKEEEAVPDKVHLVFELAKNVHNKMLEAGTQLKAGKDSEGNDLYYELEEDTLINKAKVGEVNTLYVERDADNQVKKIVSGTPLANGELNGDQNLGWATLGKNQKAMANRDNQLHDANVGFVFASPILHLTEGRREIHLQMDFKRKNEYLFDILKAETEIKSNLKTYFSGKEAWLSKTIENIDICHDKYAWHIAEHIHSEFEKIIGKLENTVLYTNTAINIYETNVLEQEFDFPDDQINYYDGLDDDLKELDNQLLLYNVHLQKARDAYTDTIEAIGEFKDSTLAKIVDKEKKRIHRLRTNPKLNENDNWGSWLNKVDDYLDALKVAFERAIEAIYFEENNIFKEPTQYGYKVEEEGKEVYLCIFELLSNVLNTSNDMVYRKEEAEHAKNALGQFLKSDSGGAFDNIRAKKEALNPEINQELNDKDKKVSIFIRFTLEKEFPAVVHYNRDVLEGGFDTPWPLTKWMVVNNGTTIDSFFKDPKDIHLADAPESWITSLKTRIAGAVSGISLNEIWQGIAKYDPNGIYEEGNLVHYNKNVYAFEELVPGKSTAWIELQTATDYSDEISYQAKNTVAYKGFKYVSLTDNNKGNETDDGKKWIEIPSDSEIWKEVPVYNLNNHPYAPGSVVRKEESSSPDTYDRLIGNEEIELDIKDYSLSEYWTEFTPEPFVQGKEYRKGAVVEYNSKVYVAQKTNKRTVEGDVAYVVEPVLNWKRYGAVPLYFEKQEYVEGDLVRYQGEIFECVATTGSISNPPSKGSSDWQHFYEPVLFTDSFKYRKWNKVKGQGKVYVSEIDDNSNSLDHESWRLFIEDIPEYTDNKNVFIKGELVKYGFNKLYIMNEDDDLSKPGMHANWTRLEHKTASQYKYFEDLQMEKLNLWVEVTGMQNHILQNDNTILDSNKPFMPFGNQPLTGSSFYIGNNEVFRKKLDDCTVRLEWMDLPDDFSEYYKLYFENSNDAPSTSDFKASFAVLNKGKWDKKPISPVDLFPVDLFSSTGKSTQLYTFKHDEPGVPNSPVVNAYHSEVNNGFLKMELGNQDFLHNEYVKAFSRISLSGQGDKTPPNPPYTPLLKSVEIDYSSSIEIDHADLNEGNYHKRVEQFYQIGPFGQTEVYPTNYPDESYVASRHIFPTFSLDMPHGEVSVEGASYLGIKDLAPPDSLRLLFQLLEGSAQTDVAKPQIQWSYLKNNKWVIFNPGDIVHDETLELKKSGVLRLGVPADAMADNTILPKGMYWLRMATDNNPEGVSRMKNITAQGARAVFADNNNSPDHLTKPLPESTIGALRFKNPAIKSVKQPFVSFDGRPKEESNRFYIRAAEQLRHKQRAVSTWDYEHLILNKYPFVNKVKCLNNMNGNGELLPGTANLILIPRVQGLNAIDKLKPGIHINQLDEIKAYLQSISGIFVDLSVQNPEYVELQVNCKVKFKQGIDAGYYLNLLEEDIKQFIAPWLVNDQYNITFGGGLHESVLIDFMEEREYVDYLVDFSMTSRGPETGEFKAVKEVLVSGIRSVLTTANKHLIEQERR